MTPDDLVVSTNGDSPDGAHASVVPQGRVAPSSLSLSRAVVEGDPREAEGNSCPPGYAELAAATNFSFLHGASHPEDLVLRAILLGHTGIGIADRNTVAGVVRAYAALEDLRRDGLPAPLKVRDGSGPGEYIYLARDDATAWAAVSDTIKARAATFKLAAGCRLVFVDGTPDIIAYPCTRAGWATLCRLLTAGKRRAEKGDCILTLDDLAADLTDLVLIVMPPPRLFPSPHFSMGRGRHDAARQRHAGEGQHPHQHSIASSIASGCPSPAASASLALADAFALSPWKNGERESFATALARIAALKPPHLHLAATMHRRGDDRARLDTLARLAMANDIPLVAVNDVLYDTPAQRPVQDVLTCIRLGLTLDAAGRRLEANAERHLKSADAMAALFRDQPGAIAQTLHCLARVGFSLGELKYEYPEETTPPGHSPQSWLEALTRQKANARYPHGVPDKVACQIREELALIAQLDYAPYFLTIHDIVAFADSRGILCQGRGSAANSAVCYVLGITAVDPAQHNLLFARFISKERREPPDIDVDFEHERREEVIQYIYDRYGRERAGIVATVIRYRPRSAIREVGKVLGLSDDITGRIAGTVWGSHGATLQRAHLQQAGLDPDNPVIATAIDLATRILGFPRHLSQHVGGFVLARARLDDIVPIGNAAMANRTFIEWDKDDIDTLGLMKVDVLALGMLTCIRKALDLMRHHEGVAYDLASVPAEQADVYAMLQQGDSVGVFQVESRAQMNMLPRMKPKEFYDLVIQVAIVRPGPIQGDMVHPYLRRRNGLEPVTYPSPAPPHDPHELYHVLSRTKGVPLFQEQAMQLAMVAAEFTDVEANRLRRAMATFRNVGTIHTFETLMVERMIARGYEPAFAQRCFEQIKGFGEYGFPESHAASFAKLVYVSSFIKCRYPAVFACALLNAQPMGFYAPAQIVRDARDHGVTVYEADVNASHWDNTLCLDTHGRTALRLGLRQIDGMREPWAAIIAHRRGNGYASIETLVARTHLPARALRLLADADCFRSIGIDRRNALWAVRRFPEGEALPLFAAAQEPDFADEPDAHLPEMPLAEHVAADYQTARLSLKGHPMQFLREVFTMDGIVSCRAATERADGAWTRAAGIVLVRQRPGKGNAIFITLEDETGILNVVLWARQFETFRAAVMGARLMAVEGRLQRSPEGIVHLMAARVIDRSAELRRLSDTHETTPELAPADEFLNPQHPRTKQPRTSQPQPHHPRDVRLLPQSRDFH